MLEQPFTRAILSHLLGVDDLDHQAVDQLPGSPSQALTLFSKDFARERLREKKFEYLLLSTF